MEPILIKNAIIPDPDGPQEPVSILIEGGKVAEISSADITANSAVTIDAADRNIFPGFIDAHIHGAVGVDVNAADAEGLLRAAAFLATQGVTAWVPTLVPDSDENYRRVIGEIDRLIEMQKGKPVAQAVGVHYEGVFANEKMCGALRPEYFKRYTGGELAELPRLKSGVHMMTFAPEIDGGIELAADLTRCGWIASIGHTRADSETLDKAFAAGARHMTHFFNAMTGIHHRDRGVAGWGLTTPDVTFDIIADGIHVHPAMLELVCRDKTPEKVSLISDSVAPTGLGDGSFSLWGETVDVRDGRTQNERGSIAGSVITMLDAVKQLLSLGFTESDVAKMASRNPARLIGIDDNCGSIEQGKRADLVILDNDRSPRVVIIGGRFVDLGE